MGRFDFIALCGRTTNHKGKRFTEESLAAHEAHCRDCRNTRATGGGVLSQLDTSDMPDGAYFAFAEELGEDVLDDLDYE